MCPNLPIASVSCWVSQRGLATTAPLIFGIHGKRRNQWSGSTPSHLRVQEFPAIPPFDEQPGTLHSPEKHKQSNHLRR
jgi:hypothetical protein